MRAVSKSVMCSTGAGAKSSKIIKKKKTMRSSGMLELREQNKNHQSLKTRAKTRSSIKKKTASIAAKVAEIEQSKRSDLPTIADKIAESIFVLQENYTPEEIKGRDEEKEIITNFIIDGINSEGNSNALCSHLFA